MENTRETKSKDKPSWTDKGGFWMGLFAALLAIISLWFSFWQYQQQNDSALRLQVAQNRPWLNIEYKKLNSEQMNGLLLSNDGQGPALIESFEVCPLNKDLSVDTCYNKWLDWKEFESGRQYKYESTEFLEKSKLINNERASDLFLVGTTRKRDGFHLSALPYNKSKDHELLDSVMVIIRYKSLSSIDSNMYFLRFSERFLENNMRDSTATPIWEK